MNRKVESRVSVVLFRLLWLLGFAGRTCGVVDYCSEHTYETTTSYLQFTKELSNNEYALVGKFKSLHCCAKGYRSIEWYKDGAAYPWSSGVSNLILYPESANQTVYAQTTSTMDKGNYTCVVRNDSYVISHSVVLVVFEPEADEVGYTGLPLPTYEPKDRFARKGHSARFFCEAFVGRVDLPDAKSEVGWWRSVPSASSSTGNELVSSNAIVAGDGDRSPQLVAVESSSKDDATDVPTVTLQGDSGSRHHHHHHFYHRKHHVTKPKPRFHQEVVPREDNQILGAYLIIREVQSEDYGEYSCYVHNAAGEKTLRMTLWPQEGEEGEAEQVGKEVIKLPAPDHSLIAYMVAALLSVMLVVLVVMSFMTWKTKIYLLMKHYWKKREDGDGKEYDICVFYEDKGKPFSSGSNMEKSKCMALSSIIPTFESHHGYQCFTHPIPHMDQSPLTDGEKGMDDCVQVR